MEFPDAAVVAHAETGRTDIMKLRKLDPSEHGKTRELWEKVFPEDTKQFLDYYYYIKARDNRIYVVEEDQKICSMIHLNPYMLHIQEGRFPSVYIVAVATREEYRSRGYMRALLRKTLEDLYRDKMPFVFLMPAAEAIYTPYDFRFIYDQERGTFSDTGGTEGEILSRDATLWDAYAMSEFYETNFSPNFQVCAVRDNVYCQTMIMEQQSQRGGVRTVWDNSTLVGVYPYAREEGLQIREPLFLEGYQDAFEQSVRELAGGEKMIEIQACSAADSSCRKPLIMARIVCLKELLSALHVPEELSVDCSFAVMDTLVKQNSRVWKVSSGAGDSQLCVRETEDSEGILPIADLTEVLFGRCTMSDLEGRSGVIMTEHLRREMEKISKLSEVFLNEVV